MIPDHFRHDFLPEFKAASMLQQTHALIIYCIIYRTSKKIL